MEMLRYILLGVDGILCLVIIALMLLQAGKGAGSSIMGGESTSDSSEGYLSHNKDRSRDARLRRATLTCGILFMIITYVLGLLYII